MTISEVLADIAINTPSEKITEGARKAARKMILDTVACIIAGWSEPGVKPIVGQMRQWGGAEESGLFVHGGKLPTPNAAFANSVMAHALDYDDIHIPSCLHIMSIVFPVAVALAEVEKKNGSELAEAVVLGVETACRVGIPYCARRSGHHGHGLLPTSIIGGFGAAAAAGRLMDLSVKQTVNALGIYYAQTSGNRQALYEKTLTKRMQPAFAARSAIWSAALAKQGLTGAAEAFEGKGGLFYVYQGAEPPGVEEIAGDRGFFEIERDSVKRYTSCGACHASTEAAIAMGKKYDLKPEDIEQIYLSGVGPGGLVGDPFEIKEKPQVDAQFCAAYGAALGLLRKDASVFRYTDEAILQDTEVCDLAKRVGHIKDEDLPPYANAPENWPEYVGRYHMLTVKTKDGKIFKEARNTWDVLSNESTYEDVVRKFHECASYSGVCPEERAAGIAEKINELDNCADISFLTEPMNL